MKQFFNNEDFCNHLLKGAVIVVYKNSDKFSSVLIKMPKGKWVNSDGIEYEYLQFNCHVDDGIVYRAICRNGSINSVKIDWNSDTMENISFCF